VETSAAASRSVCEYRVSLRAAGFAPIPVAGKRPPLKDWQTKGEADAAEIASWDTSFPGCTNTGILTERTPALDIDIKQQDAADAVSELVRELYGDKGTLLTRFGLAPKRAILFRTSQPFSKQRVAFTAPDGSSHAVEFLGSGQQIVVDGTHPDTRKPYSWHGGYAPGGIQWADLPEIGEEEAATLLTLIAEMLAAQFWFQEQQTSSVAPLDGGDRNKLPVDVEAELAAMAPGSVNKFQCIVTASLLSRGVPLQDVVNSVCDATLEMTARHGLTWTREQEIEGSGDAPGLHKICASWIKKLNDDYDHRLGEVPAWVPEDLHDKWAAALAAGRRPKLVHKGFKAEVRSWEGAEIIPFEGQADTVAEQKPAPPPPKRFSIRPFVPFDLAALPPRQWLYGKHYQRRTVSATIAPGGFGKTTLGMVEAVAMATCRDVLDEQPEARLRVWYHNGEDNLEELNRRLGAICLHYKIPQEELQGWFFMSSGNEVPLRVANGYNELRIDKPLIKCIEEEIARNEIDVALLDPLITLHGVSEQDNSKMDTVVRIFAGIADAEDCAIGLVHHTRKQPPGATGSDYGVDDMRGASATRDAVRAARMLNQMGAKEAGEVGIQEHERTSYFRVDRVKGNNAPPDKAVWRRFVNVELPNGDSVGVVAPWLFPGQDSPSPEMTAANALADGLFVQLLVRLTLNGRIVSDRAGINYAPTVFSREPEAKAAKVGKKPLVEAMLRLFKGGRIRAESTGEGATRSTVWWSHERGECGRHAGDIGGRTPP
jgi:hypothetical protein